jgi:signal transduction histidine kinase
VTESSCRADGNAELDELRFLKGLIDGMRCGILTIDDQYRLRLINGPARQILELNEPPESGTPLAEGLAGHPRLAQVLRESFDMSSLPNRAEIALGDGGTGGKTIGFTISLVRDTVGAPCGAAMFFKDLTQIEQQEEQHRLKDRLAALGEMAASTAHEIRNPLASIEVTCTLLKRRLGSDPSGQDLLAKIVDEVRRLDASVNSSLEFVRPVSLELVPTRILPLLEEAISIAEDRRGKPGIVVKRRFREEISPFLMDRARLRDVFVNLILNAMEAVGDEGTVTVRADALKTRQEASVPYRPAGDGTVDPWQGVEQFVVVRVSDTGAGVAEEERDRIFYPFFTTKERGSGVGLATAKKIVGSHRGLIDVESTAGSGAEFSVRLPMVTQEAEVLRT